MELGKIGAGSGGDSKPESGIDDIAGAGIEVLATNETVRIVGEAASWNDFCQVLEKMEAPGYWHKPELMDAIIAMLPDWRLSKFQPYLPPEGQSILVAYTILDLPGVIRFLNELQKEHL